MKKFFYSLVLMVAGFGSVYANGYSGEMLNDGTMSVLAASVDGVYVGKATPTKMNGLPITSGKSYACEYSIEAGILSGNFKVGPHNVIMNSKEKITGVGTYAVSGKITLGNLVFNFSGYVNVTSADGQNLEFSCHVKTNTTHAVSEFSFIGSR